MYFVGSWGVLSCFLFLVLKDDSPSEQATKRLLEDLVDMRKFISMQLRHVSEELVKRGQKALPGT